MIPGWKEKLFKTKPLTEWGRKRLIKKHADAIFSNRGLIYSLKNKESEISTGDTRRLYDLVLVHSGWGDGIGNTMAEHAWIAAKFSELPEERRGRVTQDAIRALESQNMLHGHFIEALKQAKPLTTRIGERVRTLSKRKK
ncbi:TPA: hypothetical protein HA244_01960 [Candidatus Micrarchaeota archaeon]|nr:hypothetical protein [Candidatus Micrarchaeota archaeon]